VTDDNDDDPEESVRLRVFAEMAPLEVMLSPEMAPLEERLKTFVACSVEDPERESVDDERLDAVITPDEVMSL